MKNYLFIIFLSVFSITPAFAKFPSPELQEVYPAGAQAGTEVIVRIDGEDLEGIEGLQFSTPQIKAERVYHLKSKNWSEPRPKGKTFKVTIPQGIEPGNYDVRVLSYYGLSSPRIFQVSSATDAKEINSEETGKNNSVETAKFLGLESVANGKIQKQLADYYKLTLKKGQRVLIHCWAERLGSKLDAKLTLFNSKGQEIYNNNDYIGRDPLIDFTAPESTDYFVSVSDHTWEGNKGYFYRLKVSQKPYIETVFPAVVKKGKAAQHIVYGRNLPGGKKTGETINGGSIESVAVEIQASMTNDDLLLDGSRPLLGFYDGINYRFKGSNAFRLAFTENDSVMEREQEADIPVKIPCEILGQFNKEEDIDRYRFSAKKGDKIWLEIFADRQFSKSDPFIVVEKISKDKSAKETAKELKSLDDYKKVKTQGMYDIHTYDNGMEIDIDADGDYRIIVGDNFVKHGVLHHYRVHLSHSKPDFQMLTFVEQFHFYGDRRTTVYPGALQLRPEGILPIRVRACRKGGRELPIELRVEGLPEGVKALPANIFPGEEEAYIVLVADKKIKSWNGNIQVWGKINCEKPVERNSTGATLNWSGTEITYGYTQRLRARRTRDIPLALLGDELPCPITLGQKEPDKIWDFKKKQTNKIPLVSTRTDDLKGAVTVMEFGAAHKLRFPFRINVSGNKETTLNLSYHPGGSNEHLLGEGAFIMRGWADVKYTTYQKGGEEAKALKSRIDAKVKEVSDAQVNADKELKKIKTELANALKMEKAAADKAKAEAEKAAKEKKEASKPTPAKDEVLASVKLQEAVKTADAQLKTANEDLKEIKAIQKDIHKEVARIEKLSKEMKFRAGFFSLPVRFRIVDEVKQEAKK